MRYNPAIHHRRSIRLQGYDYRQPGSYFFTTCVNRRRCIFGEVVAGQMRCNALGDLVWKAWLEIPNHYSYFALDEFIVMPNHVHGILVIVRSADQPVWEGIKSLKSTSSAAINELVGSLGKNNWQRNYWEHIIRDPNELSRIRKYIRNNPMQWEMDRNHPKHKRRKNPDGWDEM